MKFKALLFATLLLVSCSFTLPGFAQVKSGIQQQLESQLPGILPHLVDSEETTRFNVQRRGNDVLDLDAGVLRARYRISSTESFSDPSPANAARAYLATVQQDFGLSSSLDNLDPVEVIQGTYGSHITFQQTINGIPVYDRYVKVNLSASGAPTMVLSGFAPHMAAVTNFDTQPALSAEASQNAVKQLVDNSELMVSDPTLVVYPSDSPRLAWRLLAWPESPAVELEVLVDAEDASIIKIQNTSTHLHDDKSSPGHAQTGENNTASANHLKQDFTLVQRTTGQGFVYDPDPLTTAGLFYAPPYVDNNDNDNDELNAQRILVDLPDISQDTDGLYRLIGPHVQIVQETSGGATVYTPPAEPSPDGFRYSRANPFFEAVNVYYHVDKSQRYLQSLDVGHDIQNGSIRINPHGLGPEDNSKYFTGQNYIAFGLGGVDDAEDAFVIWHEYGHALLQGSAPGLLSSSEGQALHEGWADYWAASYSRAIAEENIVPRDDWRTLFKWDSGDGSIWQGREMTFTGKYPDDVFCDTGGFRCDIYEDGIMWASTLMDIFTDLGRHVTDRLALASHAYLSHPVSFRDAAEAMIQADIDLNAGTNVNLLIQVFNDKGLLDVSSFGPLVLHDEIQSTEQLGGTIPVSVSATPISAPINRVSLFYRVNGGTEESIQLTDVSSDTYSGLLPLSESPGEVTYFIEVEDNLGLTARLPASDFLFYSFNTGPDNEPPFVQHDEHESVSLTDWPASLTARVTDNLRIESVNVSFLVHNSLGEEIAADSFALQQNGDEFSGVFPVDLDLLDPGSSVSYRFIAKDASVAGNETTYPESGYFVFNISIENGIFRRYDFESEIQNLSSSGSWERGKPSFTLQFARSGENAWATSPAGAYTATAQLSSLELPPINLIGLPEAYLAFWHWFDTEHDGTAGPDSPVNSTLWDGGNIKVSTDGGISWTILAPDPDHGFDYNGTIAAGRENPLRDEPAFGGYSFGWQQVLAPLPVGSEVRIRFDFGTDSGNSEAAHAYAGWFIDDILVLTEKPVDTTAPIALLQPQSLAVRDPGDLPPEPTIELYDSTGIASVFVDYAFTNNVTIPDGSFRLPMSLATPNQFTGAFPFAQTSSLNVGDILTFRIRVSDFAGNTSIFPPPEETSFTVEYRLRDHIDLKTSATPSGLWQQIDENWELSPDAVSQDLSSLVIGPLDLPANVDNLQLSLVYEYSFASNQGGNLKLSLDDAQTWNVIGQEGTYNGFLSEVEAVPEGMRGQSAFTGSARNLRQVNFDLLEHKGKQAWLRIDFGTKIDLDENTFWRITDASLAYSTLEAANGTFEFSRELALHENYPDPFSTTTNVSYSLPEATSVRLELYDLLGRRLMTLVDQEQQQGTYNVTLDGAQLPNGLYLLRLATSQGNLVERVIVSK